MTELQWQLPIAEVCIIKAGSSYQGCGYKTWIGCCVVLFTMIALKTLFFSQNGVDITSKFIFHRSMYHHFTLRYPMVSLPWMVLTF